MNLSINHILHDTTFIKSFDGTITSQIIDVTWKNSAAIPKNIIIP